MFCHISKGSWTLSHQDHGWQVSDCTAEGLKVIDFPWKRFKMRSSSPCVWLEWSWLINSKMHSIFPYDLKSWSLEWIFFLWTVLSIAATSSTRNCWPTIATAEIVWCCQYPPLISSKNYCGSLNYRFLLNHLISVVHWTKLSFSACGKNGSLAVWEPARASKWLEVILPRCYQAVHDKHAHTLPVHKWINEGSTSSLSSFLILQSVLQMLLLNMSMQNALHQQSSL